MMSDIINSKVVRIISNIIEWIMGIFLIILVFLTLFQSISKQGDFFGYRIYIVGSDSMEPLYYTGDTLLVKEMVVGAIDEGDTITYVGNGDELEGLIITHQLKKKELDENGKYLLHVKGIANDVEDPIVYEDQVLGKVVYKFLILSLLGKIITSNFLTIMCITVPLVLLIVIEIIRLICKKDIKYEMSENKDENDDKNNNIDKEMVKSTQKKDNGIKQSKQAVKIAKIEDIIEKKE